MKHVILHVGTHKTGTTSFQEWIRENRKTLRKHDIHYFPFRHHDVHISSIRKEIVTTPIIKQNIQDRDEVYRKTREKIADFMARRASGCFLISSEHISFIRTKEECERLRSLFPEGTTFKIVIVFRDKDEFIESYKMQMQKNNVSPSSDRSSIHYVEPDSWLFDFDALETLLRDNFETVSVLEYSTDNVVSRLLMEIGMPELEAGAADLRFNVSPRSRIRLWAERAVRGSRVEPLVRAVLRVARRMRPNARL